MIAAVLPAGVAAWAPATSTGQRIDRVGFLVAGLLVGFGLSRLTAWMSPPTMLVAAATRHAARIAHPSVHPGAPVGTRDAIDHPAVPVERPVLYDHAQDETAVVAAELPVHDAAPVEVAPTAAPAKRAKGGRKKASPATTAVAVEPVVAVEADGPSTDPVDLVGLATRALATQLQPGARDVASVFSALDASRVAAPKVTPSRLLERARTPVAEATTAPARGEAPPTGKRVTVRSEPPSEATESSPDERRPAPMADGPEPSVVELLAKRAAANGSSVWSLAMAGSSGSATWALAPTAEAARKAAEDAVREAVDSAGRPDADGEPVDRGARPIVGRIPQRDR